MDYTEDVSSPKAKERIESHEDKIGLTPDVGPNSKYKLGELAIGRSKLIPFEGANEISIRNAAVAAAKRMPGKKFIVIKWREYGFFELARIA